MIRAESIMAEKQSKSKPKVLFISTGLPWPLDCGFYIRIFENLKALDGFCDVTVVSMIETEDAQDKIENLTKELPNTTFAAPVFHPIHIRKKPVMLAWILLKSFLSRQPYKIVKFISRPMLLSLTAEAKKTDFDIVYCDHLASSIYMYFLKNAFPGRKWKFVIEEHNVESLLIKEFAKNRKSGFTRMFANMEYGKTQRYEAEACRDSDMVVTISEQDRDDLCELGAEPSKIFYLPPSVGELRDSIRHSVDGEDIVFVGQMSWPPNEEAIYWFSKSILPVIKQYKPKVEVNIVGSGMASNLDKQLRDNGAKPLGYVKNLDAVYGSAGVFIAPFLTGGGVRIKLLDAMKAGLPIVTTSVGAKGLNIENGVHVMVADEPEEFAKAVIRVLGDKILANSLAENSRKYVKKYHSRDAIRVTMERSFDKLRN